MKLLVDLGIEYVVGNPGASYRGLHDALVHTPDAPPFITCLDENIAVGVAHGIAKASGRPAAVALHNVVGLQNGSMAIYNAWADRVPMLILGGTGPMDAHQRRPWVDWVHTALVQGNLVRDFVKWDDQPASIAALPESFIRGFGVAMTPPRGPVYICLDSMLQEGAAPALSHLPDPSRFAALEPMAAEATVMQAVANRLRTAKQPVVLADNLGRSQAAFERLVSLADLLALPVVDRERPYNKAHLSFPTRHPLNASGIGDALLEEADLILALDPIDLAGSLRPILSSGRYSPPATTTPATVIRVGSERLRTSSWATDYQRLVPVDVDVAASVDTFLADLIAACTDLPVDDDVVEARRADLHRRISSCSAGWQDAAASHELTHASAARVIDEATRGHPRVIANGHLRNWMHRLWSLDDPGEYLGGSGGGGLGYGLAATVGVALASRHTHRIVIDLQTDGDLLYAPAALWTLARERLPVVILVDNNAAYGNSVEHALHLARLRNRPAPRWDEGTLIRDPEIDLGALSATFSIEFFGVVRSVSQLQAASASAVEHVVRGNGPALVDMRLSSDAWRRGR